MAQYYWQNHMLAVFIFLFLNNGCKNNSQPPQELSEEIISSGSETTYSKKGAAIHYSTPNWPDRVLQLQPHWHYHWGPVKSIYQPVGIEFVPMVWGHIQSSPRSAEELKLAYEDSDFRYLLAFNEPDSIEQSNLSIEEALTQWQELASIGVPLVSPSTVSFDNEWMVSFIDQANIQGTEVNYLAMHWFSNPNPDNFLSAVDQAYELYGLPIWITEFAVADWEMPQGENRWSEGQVIEFMQTVLPELDNRSYVFRYAWFNGQRPELETSALFNPNQSLTELGKVYRNHTPNLLASSSAYTPYLANPANNQVINGNFEVGGTVGWSMSSASIANFNHTDIEEGYLAARLEPVQGQITQAIVDLSAIQDQSYVITFMAKGSEDALITLELSNSQWSDNTTITANTEWQTFTYEFTYPANISQPLQINFTNWSDDYFYLDAIILTTAE